MKNKQTNTQKSIFIFIFCAIVTVAVATFLLAFGFKKTNHVEISYNDSSSAVNYQVCNLDTTSELINKCSKEEVYIADLIEYIKANYSYNADFSAPVTGNVTYQLVASVSANQRSATSTAQFGEKKYPLTELQTKYLSDASNLLINQDISIDYNSYNQILATFRQYSPGAGGTLKINLVIAGQLTTVEYPDVLDYNATLGLEMPLAQADVTVKPIATSSDQSVKTFKKDINIDSDAKRACRIAGIVAAILFIVELVVIIAKYRATRADFRYEDNVDRLLGAYDSIIVDIKSEPNLRNFNINEVEDFDELIDVYNAVHMPINFYRTATTSNFVIMSESIAWRFVIRASDFRKKED